MKALIILFFILSIADAIAAEGDIFKYASRGRRDPLVPLIGPEQPMVGSLEDITSIEDVKLEGIAIAAAGRRIALINGEMLKENSTIGMLTVKKITNKAVTLLIGNEEYNIKLPEEGGFKSEK